MNLVVAGCHRANGSFLLQMRPENHSRYPGRHEFPGGSVEPGETMREALVREWQEELGVSISVGDLLAEYKYDENTLVVLFEVDLLEGMPVSTEGAKVHRATVPQLIRLTKYTDQCVPSMGTFLCAVLERFPVMETEGPRPLTILEMRKEFMHAVRGTATYWGRTVHNYDLVKDNNLPEVDCAKEDLAAYMLYAAEGAAFSFLNILDGTSTGLPAFDLIPAPHPDDKEYCREEGENWWSPAPINDCYLHELLRKR